MEKFKTIVIDDEDDIRAALIDTLNEGRYFSVVGQAHSISQAKEVIKNTQCDVIFLDIKIKGGDAFLLLDKLLSEGELIPPIILNTGFSKWEFALKALNNYKAYIIELLEKPFWDGWKELEERLYLKVRERQNSFEVKDSKLKLQIGKLHYIIPIEEILFIESDTEKKGRSNSVILTLSESVSFNISLKSMKERLPNQFIQINRFTILNKDRIRSFHQSDNVIKVTGTDRTFHVTDSFKSEFLSIF